MRKRKQRIFEEIIIGIGGKDALTCLDQLDELQKGLLDKKDTTHAVQLKELQKKVAACPLRYRIIYKGFCNGWSLEKLYASLEEKQEKRLYIRDLIEATLVYAFRKQQSYAEWRQMVDALKELEEDGQYDELLITGGNGSYTAFPLEKIEAYVKQTSLVQNEKLYTLQKTRTIEKYMDDIRENRDFMLYISENVRNFCEGREKARYYICKYFLLYLHTKIDAYLNANRSRTARRNIYLELPLSNISAMDPNRHANMSEEEVRQCLHKAKVSSNKLFELFNHFYDYILLSDSEAEDPGWEEYSLMSRILRGDAISRTLLLLLLIFFETEAEIWDEGLILTRQRTDEILTACRFEPLCDTTDEEHMDYFVLAVLQADDRKKEIEDLIYQRDAVDVL